MEGGDGNGSHGSFHDRTGNHVEGDAGHFYSQPGDPAGRPDHVKNHREEEGKLIRQAFVASHDYLISFDYSQIELRILAHLAQVKSLIDAFHQNKDIHTHTAALVFKVKDEDVTPQMRRQAKAVNFGIIYGMGEFRLSKQIGVTLSEAKEFIRRYFEEYPEIQQYMHRVVEDCKKMVMYLRY